MAVRPINQSRPFAVVTGASRGIGAAYARALADRGYDLLLVSRDRARMEHVMADCVSRHAVTVDCLVLDLAESDAAHRLYAAARERRATADLLVNNAGFGAFGDFVTMPMRQVQNMLHLHVNTVVESVRLFLPEMIERRAGAIVTVASIAGFSPIPYLTEYAATKAFLISFCEGLAEEVRGTGVRIQACCPGTTETDFFVTAGFRPRNPFGATTSEAVVETSLTALANGCTVVTIGWQGRAMSLLGRWVPHSLIVKMARRWTRSPSTPPEPASPTRSS